MKKILFFILILMPLFYSCSNDNDPLIGGGSDPKLNISEYTFGQEGGHLEVYSTIGCGLMLFRASENAKDTIDENELRVVYQDWFVAKFKPVDNVYYRTDTIVIDVKPNDTGKERSIPIAIANGDFGCQTNYKQAAE